MFNIFISIVVITHSKSIIIQNPDYPIAAKKVIRPAALRLIVETMDNTYQENKFNKAEMQKFARTVLKLHTQSNSDIMKAFNIAEREIAKGIYCDDCSRFSVIRIRRSWRCSYCGMKKENAYINALIDYYLLKGSVIKNGDFRRFLGVSSVHVASNILRSLKMPSHGGRRHRTYELQIEQLQKRLQA